jgi:exopolyphosphatase/guanosine-5'-triphosphate,3'-diphosphate pyrophosphatase
MRFAAIDIGSNAIRILFKEVYTSDSGPIFKKLTLIRLPIRLGEDSFKEGKISEKKELDLMKMAHAFDYLCSIYDVKHYRAVATSAMRDSENGPIIVDHIKNEAGLEIDIISGEEESQIIYDGIMASKKLDTQNSYMFVDVGGGSTEINFFVNGERTAWKSFNLGTIRLKEKLDQEDEWSEFEKWIKRETLKWTPKFAVGTGGNINTLYKSCGLSNWKTLSRSRLKEKLDFLATFSTEELITKLKFKPDRADVIIEGGSIYFKAMKIAKIKKMIVPKVGLTDGLIRQSYFNNIK